MIRDIERLEVYLHELNELKTTPDLVYLCIGAGKDAPDQVWPGFVFDAINKGKNVLVIDFEQHINDTITHGKEQMKELYEMGHPSSGKEGTCSAQIFACGWPVRSLEEYYDGLNQEQRKFYPTIHPPAGIWPGIKIASFMFKLQTLANRMLEEGKTLVIGDHRGCFDAQDSAIEFYNECVEKRPGNVHLLCGYFGLNVITHETIDDDFEFKNLEQPLYGWTKYHRLLDCQLP